MKVEVGKVYKRYFINHSCEYLGKPVTTSRIVKILHIDDKGTVWWQDVKRLHLKEESRQDELWHHHEIIYEKLKLTDVLYG